MKNKNLQNKINKFKKENTNVGIFSNPIKSLKLMKKLKKSKNKINIDEFIKKHELKEQKRKKFHNKKIDWNKVYVPKGRPYREVKPWGGEKKPRIIDKTKPIEEYDFELPEEFFNFDDNKIDRLIEKLEILAKRYRELKNQTTIENFGDKQQDFDRLRMETKEVWDELNKVGNPYDDEINMFEEMNQIDPLGMLSSDSIREKWDKMVDNYFNGDEEKAYQNFTINKLRG